MKTAFELVADSRDAQGKSASRRLRRTGKVPGILYGGNIPPQQIILDHRNLLTILDNERFYTSILSLKIDGKPCAAILKDVQRHPAKNAVLHMDLQRVLGPAAYASFRESLRALAATGEPGDRLPEA